MYLTRLTVDPNKRESALCLYDRGRLHSKIEDSFVGERQRPLWRLDKEYGRYVLLILSRDIPNLTEIENSIGCGDGRTIPYDDYLNYIITDGAELRFRVSVNPTIRRKKDGATVPLNLKKTENYPYSAEDWLIDKLKTAGSEPISVSYTDSGSFRIKGGAGRVFNVTYEGIIRVTNANALKDAMQKGIGRKHTYGCGLLTVMPC